MFPSVVINDFNIRRTVVSPDKANPELVVYPDRILALAIAAQGFEMVARRRPQVAEIFGRIQVAQFPARAFDQVSRESFRRFAIEQGPGKFAAEAPDHQ